MPEPRDQPVLSIIIPMYNARATIERTVRSLAAIRASGPGAVELIVVNDGSRDDSPAMARALLPTLAAIRGRVVDQPNLGSAAARNAGLRLARGEWVYLLDADDELLIDPLPLIREHRGASSIAWTRRLVKFGKACGRVRPPRLTPRNRLDVLTAGSPLIPSTILIRREAIDRLFDTAFLSGEDWYFWLTNPRLFDRAVTRPQIVGVAIHAHGGNKSGNYPRRGRYRQLIAERTLEELGPGLSRRQANNLRLQRRIGILQHSKQWAWRDLFRVPCSPALWFKLLVYGALRGDIGRIDFYGR